MQKFAGYPRLVYHFGSRRRDAAIDACQRTLAALNALQTLQSIQRGQ